MIIVIDTNILISALIKDSVTRKIIIELNEEILFPEESLSEIIKHREYILKKSGLLRGDFDVILMKLLENIKLIPLENIEKFLPESKRLMEKRDLKDAIFLATALSFKGSLIWSDDRDFEDQSRIKIIKTKDMIKKYIIEK